MVGLLGGMIGLGGAEFRLPLLIGVFGFVALQAVVMNKAMSLLVVLTALPARLAAVPLVDAVPALDGGRQPARRQPGRSLGRRDLGDPHAVRDALPGPGGPAGAHRRRAGGSHWRTSAVELPPPVRVVAGVAAGSASASSPR